MAVILNLDTVSAGQITMTLKEKGKIKIRMAGSGTASINWGDGITSEIKTLSKELSTYSHVYTENIVRTVTIISDNITGFNCKNIQLINLDVSKNTVLELLVCLNNQLVSLDVSNNTLLNLLDCGRNLLTNLDVSLNTELNELYCNENQLTNLDVNKNTKLTGLWCFDNKLTNLDVSKNTMLTVLWCFKNELTSLDVSRNTALTMLWCAENRLTSLDLSNNIVLQILNCGYNQLSLSAYDDLFSTLHNNHNIRKRKIYMYGNSEIKINKNHVAVKNGWKVKN